MNKELIKPDFVSLIFIFRGRKVMIDTDLAMLYDVPTKALKQQVKRNLKRFPEDFMFELNSNEKNELVANCDRLSNLKHSSVSPMAFTEQGVAMLSSILRSEKAIQINIEIMRAFATYRAILRESDSLRKEIGDLDKKLNTAFKFLLEKIDALHEEKNKPRSPIGFNKK
ncbi:MAG: ORF6N domain-containing protein [Bacteroidota bacterium]